MVKQTVPIEHKLTLTIEEAAEYSNIGQNKLRKLIKLPNCPFVLFVGGKSLIKRKEFENFISSRMEI
jgi:excisionase family DNA binding protein